MRHRIRVSRSRRISKFAIWMAIFVCYALMLPRQLLASESSRHRFVARGKIEDSLGRPIAGVLVTILNATSGAPLETTTTSAEGNYNFPAVEKGRFILLIEKAGFHSSRIYIVVPQAAAEGPLVLESEQPLTMAVRAARLNPQNELSKTGASKYTMNAKDIQELPAGKFTPLNEVMVQMPGVTLDQNQEIHIRGEHMGIQYQMNGIMLPLDINTDPTFTQLLNSFFIKRVSLLDGILPAQYGYRTAGVIDLVTKSGCDQQGGEFSILGGQRNTAEPSFEMGGCKGNFGYFVTGLYLHNNLAFSSATPAPDAIHDVLNQGQAFGNFTYQLGPTTMAELMTGFTVNDGQFPNRPFMPALYNLAGVSPAGYPSTGIRSSLEQQDYFGVFALKSAPLVNLDYQLAYSIHYNKEQFNPDPIGDLIYQGVASNALYSDLSNSFQGDVSYEPDASHALRAGFYIGEFGVEADDSSLVFPVDSSGHQLQNTPRTVGANMNRINILGGIYAQDTWHITQKLGVNFGARWDIVTGFTVGDQVSPTINFFYDWIPGTTVHAGFARYFQVPNFQAVPPDLITAFKGTSGSVGTSGNPFPVPERDYYWDAGITHRIIEDLKFENDNYFRLDRNYLDEGQFGFVPIEAPLNYSRGYGWGTENTFTYNRENLSSRLNFTVAREEDTGVDTGQFNFSPDELAYLDKHYFVLDHTALLTISGGMAYRWNNWLFSTDGQFNTGLRAGFADTETLPNVCQVNLAVARDVDLPWIGRINDRIILQNIFDRTNLIRPPTGIGVFQSAYGPRITVYDAVTVPLPAP